jgi:hypothetical protein
MILKRKKPEGRFGIGSIFGLLDGKTRSGFIPLLLLCGDFEKKVSIAKQRKMNSEAETCPLDANN